MVDVLFYESFKDDENRHRLFGRFAGRPNPFVLLPGSGELLRFEIERRKSVGSLEDHALTHKYQFHPRLAEPGFPMEPWMVEQTAARGAEYRSSAEQLAALVADVPTLLPILAGYRAGQQGWQPRFKMAYDTIAQHDSAIRSVYSVLRQPDWPRPGRVKRDWAFFRKVQTDLLFAVSAFKRYGARVPSEAISGELEHDVRDRDYALFAALAGALATSDQRLAQLVRIAEPSTLLIGIDRSSRSKGTNGGMRGAEWS
jgi:hypothetical protein